ncbi:MAG: hypothetical protein KUL75_05170, partial [Sterolibacterium sp.]|nr:hypothetical protein [Sterolibacterium sp.]
MATTAIATAISVKGTVFVLDAFGNERVLHQGDAVSADSKIIVKAGSRASLSLASGETLAFGPGEHTL